MQYLLIDIGQEHAGGETSRRWSPRQTRRGSNGPRCVGAAPAMITCNQAPLQAFRTWYPTATLEVGDATPCSLKVIPFDEIVLTANLSSIIALQNRHEKPIHRKGMEQPEVVMTEARGDHVDSNTEIDMVEAKEMWSEYRLSDGTRLRVKPVMVAVFRADGQQTAEGEPIYNMKSTLVTDVRASAGPNKPH